MGYCIFMRRVLVTYCLLPLFLFILWRGTAAAEMYAFSPNYYLHGALDLLYSSDRAAAGGTATDLSSLRQRYTLGLNGPVIGPYFGLFSLNSRFIRSDSTVNDRDAGAVDYGVGGNADLLPVSKFPLSLYFDKSRATSDASGLSSATNTDNYGLTFNPRLFRGTTYLSYDHGSVAGNVEGGSSFANTRDRESLFYRDGWKFGKDTRLDYEYRFAFAQENQENRGAVRDATQMDNDILVNHSARLGEKTQWLNSLSGSTTARRASGDGSQSQDAESARYESSLSYDYTRNIRGLLRFNHLTLKTPGLALSNADALTATGTWEAVPNPVPKLLLNLQTSLGGERDWESSRQGGSASASATSRWSIIRYFDVLNDLAYYYTYTGGNIPATAGTTPAGGGTTDTLAYRFGLRGQGTAFRWNTDYGYQQFGLLTSPVGAGSQHLFALGEEISWRDFFNQTSYTMTKTVIPGEDSRTLDHLLRSNTSYRFSQALSMQAQAYLLDTTTLAKGTTTATTSEDLSLNVSWVPFPRILMSASGEVSHSTGTGGESVGYSVQGNLNWLLRIINLRFFYRYGEQSSTGAFRSTEQRFELQATTSFDFRLGSFAR